MKYEVRIDGTDYKPRMSNQNIRIVLDNKTGDIKKVSKIAGIYLDKLLPRTFAADLVNGHIIVELLMSNGKKNNDKWEYLLDSLNQKIYDRISEGDIY